ncbi:hypothetical protein M8J76_008291 [Diaphorina citri]|nr:hypothetical protein M8J76_008291 [Diaphorina citri]
MPNIFGLEGVKTAHIYLKEEYEDTTIQIIRQQLLCEPWMKDVSTMAISKLENRVVGCQFYPLGEYLRFVRVPESLPVGGEVIQLDVYPRKNLILQPVDKPEDIDFFKFRTVNRTTVSVRLAKSLEDLVDSPNPQNVLKFRLVCEYEDSGDTVSSYLSVTVYIEDVNDHSPIFLDAPYKVSVDELTPTGLTIFKGIQAVDKDKPNTPNSDVQYSIIGGNDKGKFTLENNNHKAALVLKKPLDYEAGDTQFLLVLLATDRGNPPRNATTAIKINVNDNDDLNPKFSRDVYSAQIPEFYPITGHKIHQEIKFDPPIMAEDQDKGINTTLRYDIASGNDKHLFSIDPTNGSLYLDRELDLDVLTNNLFNLQIQASQLDNPLKVGMARVEIELLDINDNQPQFEVDIYNISIVENLPNGFSVLQVSATDLDQGPNAEFVYHLVDPHQAFSIDGKTGWLTVRNQAKLDREAKPTLSMRVFAREKLPSVMKTTLDAQDSFVAVEVTLLDANDNNPVFFPSNIYEFTITSDKPIGTIIGKIMIANAPVPIGKHSLFIEASDQPVNPSERRFSLAVVTVECQTPAVQATKKMAVQAPIFVGAPYEFWVGSEVPIGTSVGQLKITEDAAVESILNYDLLHSYHEGVPFAVEERTGTITVIDSPTKYPRSLYEFEGVVTDGKNLNLLTNVTIHVVENDPTTVFRRNEPILLKFRVRENLSGAFVGQLFPKATNTTGDSAMANKLRNFKFTIANQADVKDLFAISQDGTLYTHKGLDREVRDAYMLTIIAENTRIGARGGGLFQAVISVEDENDNAPQFEYTRYEGRVKEHAVAGTEVALDNHIIAKDIDIGSNAQFTINLIGEGSQFFTVDQKTGRLYLSQHAVLDRERKDVYNLKLVARDKGNLSSEALLKIQIEDINDHRPKFIEAKVSSIEGVDMARSEMEATSILVLLKNQSFPNVKKYTKPHALLPTVYVPENIPIGTVFLKVTASDEDIEENGKITYAVASETYIPHAGVPHLKPYLKNHFEVHPVSGEISVAGFLPAESEFRLNITATDAGGLSTFIVAPVFVNDINDNAPVFEKPSYEFRIAEGSYEDYVVGQISATDADFGENGNITYTILQKREDFSQMPLSIKKDGSLIVHGELDRELKSVYSFRVLAQDNGPLNNRLRATVDVELKVLDINDNAPAFYNYDLTLTVKKSELVDKLPNEPEESVTVPVYYTSVVENSNIGGPIGRVFANDSDLTTNGNGVFLFSIKKRKSQKDLFVIDSKEGIVTALGALDYEEQPMHNITIVAYDLGGPSMSSTALMIVNVVDVPEPQEENPTPMFAHRYYELEVEENCIVPLELLALNVSDEHRDKLGNMKFSIAPNEHNEFFTVDPYNGSLYLVVSPDREQIGELTVTVRVDKISRRGKTLQMIYPLRPESLNNLGPNEVKIIVRVLDANDNGPRFVGNGRPIVAAIPSSATYGFPIAKLHARDADAGINAEIRYEIMSRESDDTHKFTIDPLTGQLRAVVAFSRDAGKVFGFDVKATDRRGAEDGRYSIANVFVFVLDEHKKLVMVIGAKPTQVEQNLGNITTVLSNITGFDVRIRKLEPHLDLENEEVYMTDLYLYAVDTFMNTVIDNDVLTQ